MSRNVSRLNKRGQSITEAVLVFLLAITAAILALFGTPASSTDPGGGGVKGKIDGFYTGLINQMP